MRCLRLPFQFEPARLHADLAHVTAGEWIPHINRRHYDGVWSGAALRSISGAANNIVPEARGAEEFRDTALLHRCACFREVLATLRCPQRVVRLLRLHAGSSIAEHVDRALDFEDGEVRLHVPIVTSEDVRFFLDGARLFMASGECWYTNVNLPHSVENRGRIDRIHLVIDCVVDDWLRSVFASAAPPPCRHYAARLTAPTAPRPERLFETLASFGAGGPRFHAEGRTLSLTWSGPPAWQFRLRLPDASAGGGHWTLQLESSPDPERRHRADYDRVLARIGEVVPDLRVAHKGLA